MAKGVLINHCLTRKVFIFAYITGVVILLTLVRVITDQMVDSEQYDET